MNREKYLPGVPGFEKGRLYLTNFVTTREVYKYSRKIPVTLIVVYNKFY